MVGDHPNRKKNIIPVHCPPRTIPTIYLLQVVKPKFGWTTHNSPDVVCSIDLDIPPHQLRHMQITNLDSFVAFALYISQLRQNY